MAFFPVTRTEEGLHIEGLPTDAKKLVRISGNRARGLAHLGLHRSDLRFVQECLLAIPLHNGDRLVQEALWRSAVIFYIKCFQQGVRIPISADKVYKGMAKEKEGHTRIEHLRNKHFVHDVNIFSQSVPAAAINDGKKGYKVEKVVTSTVMLDTLDQGHFDMLRYLVDKTTKWVDAEIESLAALITTDLEKKSYEYLSALPQPSVTGPEVKDIAIRRTE